MRKTLKFDTEKQNLWRAIRGWQRHFCVMFFISFSILLSAQSVFPHTDGERTRYAATIEMQRGYLSGICILLREGDTIKGSLFNEFGISAIDFTYYINKDKVKLHSMLPMLDKWYMHRVLRHDLCELFHRLQEGETSYRNEHHKIDYQFIPLPNETDQ